MIRNINVNSIISGWFNYALDELGLLNEKTKQLAESRLKICETCEHRKSNRCGICGCFIIAKVRDPNSVCPNNPPKWN